MLTARGIQYKIKVSFNQRYCGLYFEQFVRSIKGVFVCVGLQKNGEGEEYFSYHHYHRGYREFQTLAEFKNLGSFFCEAKILKSVHVKARQELNKMPKGCSGIAINMDGYFSE